jgi:methylmalonyl-CoA mutase cobalamin-binding domain/chain
LVVLAGGAVGGERTAEALVSSLELFGFDVTYVGREESPRRLAETVARERADAVELCVAERMPVELVRELLRELASVGRSDTRIVLHRVA